jgi:hypothetical protein
MTAENRSFEVPALPANEAFYFACVWGVSVTAAVTAYLFLSSSYKLAFITLVLFAGLIVAICGMAASKKRKKYVYSFARPYKLILADVGMESVKMLMFSILLDATANGTTYDIIKNGVLASTGWELFRVGSVIAIMLLTYWTCTLLVYPVVAHSEREYYEWYNRWPSS